MINNITPIKKQKFYLFILNEQFSKRRMRLSNYSLRKFSLELGLEASVVSKYLRHKRQITPQAFEVIVSNLNLDHKNILSKEENFYRSMDKLSLLSGDYLDILSDWSAFAILECLNLATPINNIERIVEITGIKLSKVESLVKRLIKIGAISTDTDRWTDTFNDVTFIENEDMDTSAGRSFQKSLLDKAKNSIDNCSGNEKSHTCMIMAMDESLIPEVKAKIRDFRREISQFLEENHTTKNNVYSLQIKFNTLLSYKEI